MALSFPEAANRYAEKFPGKKLKTFDGVRAPCIIQCETHGDVRATSFKSVMESRHGCPTCGTLASRKQRVERLTDRRVAERDSQKKIHSAIRSAMLKIKAMGDGQGLTSQELLQKLDEVTLELEAVVGLAERHIKSGYEVTPVDLDDIFPRK